MTLPVVGIIFGSIAAFAQVLSVRMALKTWQIVSCELVSIICILIGFGIVATVAWRRFRRYSLRIWLIALGLLIGASALLLSDPFDAAVLCAAIEPYGGHVFGEIADSLVPRRHEDVSKGQHHCREICETILIYANEHAGRYPASLWELANNPYYDGVFAGRSILPTNYVYLGAGLRKPVNAKRIILYEKLNLHSLPGAWVCYAGGKITWVTPAAYATIVAKAKATTQK